MWNHVIGAIVGAAAGASVGAYQAKQQTEIKRKALEDAYKSQMLNANTYSGDAENRRQIGKGLQEAHNINEMQNAIAASSNDATTGNYQNQFVTGASDGYDAGYNTGVSNQATVDNARRNANEALIASRLKQAGIDYNVNAAQNQANMNAIGNVANTAKTVGNPFKSANANKVGNNSNNSNGAISMQSLDDGQDMALSDERQKTCYMSDEDNKEEVNNDSGLPASSIEDSLRQLETVLYKYKDPSIEGCDDEEHCGTTAQSLEKTDLFKDCVVTGEDGFKRVDMWKLQEALTSGIAQLQREVDDIEKEETK